MQKQKISVRDEIFFYALKHYYKPKHTCDIEEFKTDLKKFKFIKKECNKFYKTKKLNKNLLQNYLITVANIFGPRHAFNILDREFDSEEEKYFGILKPFLLNLQIIYSSDLIDINVDKQVMKHFEHE